MEDDIVCSCTAKAQAGGRKAHRVWSVGRETIAARSDKKFDGDACPCMLILDVKTIKALKPLEPHLSMFNMNSYSDASNVASFPKPVATIINNWINENDTTQMEQSTIELLGA